MALSSRKTYGGTGARRLRLDILDGRALQRTHEVGFSALRSPPGPLLFIGLTGRVAEHLPAPSFPSTRANPLNQMKGKGFVQSLESGGKRFALLAGSNRRNLVFRERASLVVKVQSNRAFIGPFVGVAEEICLAAAPQPFGRFRASASSAAILTATPISTCSRISDCAPSAINVSISMPRFIGPGCMTRAPGFA